MFTPKCSLAIPGERLHHHGFPVPNIQYSVWHILIFWCSFKNSADCHSSSPTPVTRLPQCLFRYSEFQSSDNTCISRDKASWQSVCIIMVIYMTALNVEVVFFNRLQKISQPQLYHPDIPNRFSITYLWKRCTQFGQKLRECWITLPRCHYEVPSFFCSFTHFLLPVFS